MKYKLPQLGYKFSALEPYIDEQTMQIHYTKHHMAYVDNLNSAVAEIADIEELKIEDLLSRLNSLSIDEKIKTAIRNNGGGHSNHSLFWKIMGPEKNIDEKLVAEIEAEFGSVDSFKKEFAATALSRFGSGWAWLVRGKGGRLSVYSTPNQDSPYMRGDTPIIGCDVWEHAYYLKYKNMRAQYINAWWNVCTLIP